MWTYDIKLFHLCLMVSKMSFVLIMTCRIVWLHVMWTYDVIKLFMLVAVTNGLESYFTLPIMFVCNRNLMPGFLII